MMLLNIITGIYLKGLRYNIFIVFYILQEVMIKPFKKCIRAIGFLCLRKNTSI
jgi:hypothetical protein